MAKKSKEKTEKDLLQEISNKLDKIPAALAIQNIEEKNDKIIILKKAGFTSAEIAPLIGLTESGVRDTKGWKKE